MNPSAGGGAKTGSCHDQNDKRTVAAGHQHSGGRPLPNRLVVGITIAAAAFAAVAGTARAAALSEAAAAATPTVHRGQSTRLVITTTSRAACVAEIVYSDGARQETGVKSGHGRSVFWVVRIPTNAALGRAQWTVRCGLQFKRFGTWLVQPVTASGSGSKPSPGDSGPHIAVDKQGFSQQPTGYNGGSNLSYGLLLKNTSTSEDATQVYLLINFATASGELIGTVTRTIELIGAGQLYALGDSAVLRTETPVAKLEVTIRVMAHAKAKPLPMPHFVNVRILPDQNQPDYVGEVDGEVVNDTSPFMMNSARLSIVLLNTAGEIVGGGTGMVLSPLPSGSRMVFLAQNGFAAVPSSEAVVPIITVEPSYASG